MPQRYRFADASKLSSPDATLLPPDQFNGVRDLQSPPDTSGVSVPVPGDEAGPAKYNTPEAAKALAPIWGMSWPRVAAIMGLEQGTLTPDEYDEMMRQIAISENVEKAFKTEDIQRAIGNFTPTRKE